MEHRITIRFAVPLSGRSILKNHLRRCITAALSCEKVTVPCEINVLVTDDDGIHAINEAMRKVDRPTDVLSFPMFQLTPGDFPNPVPESMTDPETGLLPLGDMVISVERARAQAEEFGHSFKRETGYLAIHSVLHLLGYDHMDDGPMKKQMRAHEERVLAEIDLPRR